ncbi:MAG: amidohydrolase family protein [Planctomycetota bacterium]
MRAATNTVCRPADAYNAGWRAWVLCVSAVLVLAGVAAGQSAGQSAENADAQPAGAAVDGPRGGGAVGGQPADALPLDGRGGRQLLLDRFRPRPQLVTPNNQPPRAKFPVVDVHVHPRIRFRHTPELLDGFVRVMDQQNIALCVSLDGRLGEELDEHLAYLAPHAGRFLVFANVDWRGDGDPARPATWACHRPGFGRRTAQQLATARRRGAVGLKVFKMLGLAYENPDGSLMAIDDPRWDPIWSACGELGMPVIIHSADPVAFFQPVDERNERWEELHRHPDWSFYGDRFPSHDALLAARNRVIARHPGTTFIGAHVANYPENLAQVSRWLDRYPNLVVEVSSRIAELGRQPYTARRFFLRHQDRIMFGSDGPRAAARLMPHWRFFETYDENFAYAENPFPPQGLWNIHGIGLPDEVLQKLYSQNAARVIPGVREKLAALQADGGPPKPPAE